MKKYNLFALSILVMILVQCGKENLSDKDAINIPEGEGFELLSEYNFFEADLVNFTPNSKAGVLPYDLNMPLFSDYALKKRFIYVPSGETVPFDTSDVLSFPTGSVLIKHFYYKENGLENNIETRLLIKRANKWQSETYEWNQDQTDAKRSIAGTTKVLTTSVNGQSQTFNYLIPNLNQCKNCHSYQENLKPIGPTIHNLNKMYSYTDGSSNQLDKWISEGILESGNLSNAPSFPEIDDLSSSLNTRARAYLAVNCSSCHSLYGSAANSGLYLEYSNSDSLSLGFYKTPVAAGGGSGGFTHVIEPGHGDESILVFRMNTSVVDERMPEIGRDIIHSEGVALIKEWIDSL